MLMRGLVVGGEPWAWLKCRLLYFMMVLCISLESVMEEVDPSWFVMCMDMGDDKVCLSRLRRSFRN